MKITRLITGIVIHCAATTNGRAFTREQIDAMHRQRGFARDAANVGRFRLALGHTLPAIGYHYVIELDGSVKQGRHLEEAGAHVQGSNARTIGICLIGTDQFSLAQWASLRLLIDSLAAQFPAASVLGHRDYSPDKDGDGIVERHEWLKICPGFEVKTWLAGGKKPLPAHTLKDAA